MKYPIRMTLAVWSACCLLTAPLVAQQRPRVISNDDLRPAPAMHAARGQVSGPAAPVEEVQPLPGPLTLPDMVTARLLSFSRSVQSHGIYFEALDGSPVLSLNDGMMYNPASVTKVMTSLAALEALGVNYRYPTRVGYTGTMDWNTGTLMGDLVISGEYDPSFATESLFLIGERLREMGVRNIQGNIRIGAGVLLNMRSQPVVIGREILSTLDRTRWTPKTEAVWNAVRGVKAFSHLPTYQGITISPGNAIVDDYTTPRYPLIEYRSSPLLKILKSINAYSNNEMTHVVGARVGGPAGVRQYLIEKVGLAPQEVYLQTTSGLGQNAVTPRATVKVMRYAVNWLEKRKLSLGELLPIAGIDTGTLHRRFTSPDLVGTVIGKTGTLSSTSALAGILYTQKRGLLFFAILERGSPHSLRTLQEEIISMVAADSGGALPLALGSEMSPSLCEDAVVTESAAARTASTAR
ncbi:MAG: D-alanyl-D-alanine carboxypeptidase [Chloracidobacterium sp.]|uniref:D-alanyl-D-alanine carboxypeptidase n=1 Tax=Chloracidobacterium validum TaxID=2821543 RepID=A0ABX8BBH4_9BACT|nr:D-alanyl-D-alanine carboxypeptidase [Chloracidobacterium validum]QUW02885.1 D-alanyl-D-alanine carboxypeptidase [Chloracidobacterium validum]